MNNISEWQAEVHGTAVEKGWWDGFDVLDFDYRNAVVGAKLALVHSEVSEALEELRSGQTTAYEGDDGKPEGMVVELADAVIRILDLCGALDLDLERAMEWKHSFNQGRSHRHGGKAL